MSVHNISPQPAMSSTADVANLTKQYLTCFVCKKLFVEPATLPCFHSFCKNCLNKLEKKICPKCEVPFDKIHKQKLKIIARVSKLHQVMEISAGDPWHKTCEQCSKTPPSIFCKECNFFSCSECFSKIHEQWKPLENHHTVNFKKMTAVIKLCDKRESSECSYHSDMLLEYYCDSCQEIVCSSCTKQKHQDHDVQRISNFDEAKMKRITIQYVEQRTITIKKNKEGIQKRIDEIKSEGGKIQNDIHLKLKELEKALQGEVHALVEEKVARLKTQIKMANKEWDSLTEYRETRRKTEKFEIKANDQEDWEKQWLKTFESEEVSREVTTIKYCDTPVEEADLMIKVDIPSVKTILITKEE